MDVREKYNYLNENMWQSGEDGIEYMISSKTETAFSDDTEENLMSLEDDSWWFRYRAEVITGFMKEYMDKNKVTVDIGGGNAYTSSVAGKMGFRTAVIEPAPAACKNAKKRNIDEVCCGIVTDESVKDSSIEQALLLDVLEHIEDDKGFLKLLRKKMKKGGILIMTVPAFNALWSSEDDAAGHFRRYRSNWLCYLLGRNGFKILYRNYFMSFLFLPILFIRVGMEKIGLLKKQDDRTEEERKDIAESQFKTENPITKMGLKFFEDIDRRMLKKSGFVPFGSSIIVVARRK